MYTVTHPHCAQPYKHTIVPSFSPSTYAILAYIIHTYLNARTRVQYMYVYILTTQVHIPARPVQLGHRPSYQARARPCRLPAYPLPLEEPSYHQTLCTYFACIKHMRHICNMIIGTLVALFAILSPDAVYTFCT
jgi:hypothetical protein